MRLILPTIGCYFSDTTRCNTIAISSFCNSPYVWNWASIHILATIEFYKRRVTPLKAHWQYVSGWTVLEIYPCIAPVAAFTVLGYAISCYTYPVVVVPPSGHYGWFHLLKRTWFKDIWGNRYMHAKILFYIREPQVIILKMLFEDWELQVTLVKILFYGWEP